MKTWNHSLVLASLALVLLVPDAGLAQRQSFPAPDRTLARPSHEDASRSRAVRVQGEITHARRGFAIDGQPLVFSSNTSFFPGISDRSRALNPKSLRGRHVTVYGRTTARGIEASLVIVSGEEPERPIDAEIDDLVDHPRVDPSTYTIPSEADENVGELTEDAPR